ncbi:YncE family protein [Lysinibacillus telephonicus]|uniref:YncE family protein n=1 Tax=Lysinibacillus telephonicus TaxID=1714840 RepID=UPI00397C9791
MNYIKTFIFLLLITVIAGCRDEKFSSINHHQSFVASVSILEPSVTFYNPLGEEIAVWNFNKAYTGAALIQQDRILLYGHQLDEADIYELSSGKELQTIKTGIGTTNVYYEEKEKKIFIANSERNSVTSYDDKGNKLNELELRNYPMSMASYNGKLYVVNYKDTLLSVVNMENLKLEAEWPIAKSSNGVLIIPEENTIWIGGHGEGSRPNQSIDVLDLQTGNLVDKIKVSMMPIGFSRNEDVVYIVNHGANELYAMDLKGNTLWKTEVGANPFSVAIIEDEVVVAGYDDHKLYFLKNGQITKEIYTNKGPFQLLVREV